jgi:hypothetical protein
MVGEKVIFSGLLNKIHMQVEFREIPLLAGAPENLRSEAYFYVLRNDLPC